jgi:SAM-dependent methyltransferase
MKDDDLAFSPAADRNKAPILEVLTRVLPPNAAVLEIASGTGQHAAHFAAAHPDWNWQPTDADPQALPCIATRSAELANVRSPLQLDVLALPWPQALGRFDAVYCANMLHIATWATCAALMQGATHHLVPGGALVLYGPYLVDGERTAPSNIAFDADLRARSPKWGLRRLADVVDEGQEVGMAFERRFDMAANNLMLVFRRGAGKDAVAGDS